MTEEVRAALVAVEATLRGLQDLESVRGAEGERLRGDARALLEMRTKFLVDELRLPERVEADREERRLLERKAMKAIADAC